MCPTRNKVSSNWFCMGPHKTSFSNKSLPLYHSATKPNPSLEDFLKNRVHCKPFYDWTLTFVIKPNERNPFSASLSKKMCKTCQVEKRPFCRPKTNIENAQRKGIKYKFYCIAYSSWGLSFWNRKWFLDPSLFNKVKVLLLNSRPVLRQQGKG